MSYGVTQNCWNCEKSKGENPCSDLKNVMDSLKKIHEDPNHKGSGNIIIMCSKLQAIEMNK